MARARNITLADARQRVLRRLFMGQDGDANPAYAITVTEAINAAQALLGALSQFKDQQYRYTFQTTISRYLYDLPDGIDPGRIAGVFYTSRGTRFDLIQGIGAEQTWQTTGEPVYWDTSPSWCITDVTIAYAGTGYVAGETLTLTGGTPSTEGIITVASVDSAGGITGITITDGGTDYLSEPVISGGSGSSATLTATIGELAQLEIRPTPADGYQLTICYTGDPVTLVNDSDRLQLPTELVIAKAAALAAEWEASPTAEALAKQEAEATDLFKTRASSGGKVSFSRRSQRGGYPPGFRWPRR